MHLLQSSQSLQLKPGLILVPLNDDEFYLGLIEGGLYIPRDPYLAIARGLTRKTSADALASQLALPETIVTSFIDQLCDYGYVEIVENAPPSHSLDDEIRGERSEVERSSLTWRRNTHDGGWGEIEARGNFPILIFGKSRIARTLLAILQASGFSRSRIVLPAICHHKTVEAKDICGVVTRKNDLGMSLNEHHRVITQGAQLTPAQAGGDEFPSDPALLIATTDFGDEHPDYLQRWMSEELIHLQISQPNPYTLEIGPMVIPGKSACINCVTLHKRDQLPPFINLFTDRSHREVGTATSTFAAGVITSYIAEFAATGSTALMTKSISINVLNPLTEIVERFWDFHPECGCR
mgnify:CR=1 FL=1